jgi:CRISPR-associated protein Csb1
MVRVDFTGHGHEDPALDLSALGGDGYLTALEVPHRLADALMRDSLHGSDPFRASPPGRRFTEASPANATALYDLCPTALVFGLWDSTGPKGGLGSKFQRALVSEIVGVGAELGAKTASRIDPVGIKKTTVYEASESDEGWTLDPDRARKVQGKPVPLKRSGQKSGSPAVINHGNVMPTVDMLAGGVTLDYAEQIAVLSLPALRRLRFPTGSDGQPLEVERREAEASARTAVAALGLAAVVYARRNGYDLRSRCAFRPIRDFAFEMLPADGSEAMRYTLDSKAASRLLGEASARAAQAGLSWRTDPIDLLPTERLVALIRRSREISVAEEGADE